MADKVDQLSNLSAEMYPGCVIAFWDALVFLSDARNIEQRVQRDTEKKSNVYANYKQKENMRTAYFTTKSNICISHDGKMIEFLKAVIFGFL